MGNQGVEFEGTDRFEVRRRIGAGGMGIVYEAYDRVEKEKVALKVEREHSPAGFHLFKDEFRNCPNVRHRNLIRLKEMFGDEAQDKPWFFTMELIEGGVDLCTYLRGPKSVRIARAAKVGGGAGSGVGDSSSSPTAGPFDAPALSGGFGPYGRGDFAPPEQSSGGPGAGGGGFVHRPRWGSSDVDGALGGGGGGGGAGSDPPLSGPEAEVPGRVGDGVDADAVELDFDRVRETFRQLARGVIALHRAGRLHRDLKPANALVRKDCTVVLLDFGLVAKLKSGPATAGADAGFEEAAAGEPGITGTFAYMSPEQAAGRSLSSASDWYSVGVMLYEALTGRLPFEGRAWDVWNAKQVREPEPPAVLAPGTPADLNDLCVDLLRRDPVARPGGTAVVGRLGGTAAGLGDDEYGEAYEPMPFVGRKAHREELDEAYARVAAAGGATVVYHVHGRSGAGKSALLEHFLEGLPGRGAVVLAGRCFEQESVPYKAVDSLIDSLARYLGRLGRAGAEAVVTPDVAALTRVFPVLREVDAVATAATAVAGGADGGGGGAGATEAADLIDLRERAFAALREMLCRIGSGQPLVLAIDDVQWGDADSGALLSAVLRTPGAPRLLLLIAYRSEHAESSPFLRALADTAGTATAPQAPAEGAEAAGSPVERRELFVDALTAAETGELAERLLPASAEGKAQARWVVRESRGSPLFIDELVRHLRSGGSRAEWTDQDLDDVLWNRVQRLPELGRRLLEAISVAGKPVRVGVARHAARLAAMPSDAIEVLREGRLIRTTGTAGDEVEAYHDRVRESVVDHLSADVRRAYHGALAAALEAEGETADPETVAKHFEDAAEPARASTYYLRAAGQAVKVLALGRAEALFERAARLAPTDAEKGAALERLIHFYTDTARFADAYAVGRRAAGMFGVTLPARFVPPLFLVDFVKSKVRLRGRPVGSIMGLPTMTNPRLESAVRVINAVAKAAYQVRPELCVAVSTKAVNLCLRHGNTRDCAIGYMVYGAIFQGGVLGKHKTGHAFGRLVLDLVAKYDNPAQRAEVCFVVGYFGTSWLRPVTEAEDLWRQAYHAGLDTGDLFHTGCAAAGLAMSYHMRGVEAGRLLEETDQLLVLLRQFNLREPIAVLTAVRQFVRNLRGETAAPDTFGGADFDESEHLRQMAGFGSRHFVHFFHVLKMQSLYLWGRYDLAAEAARSSAGYLKDSPGMLHMAEHHFYDALITAAMYGGLGWAGRLRARRALGRAHRRFARWAGSCAHNFRHKERLLAAEIHRLAGRADAARRAYDEAIAAAAEFGYALVGALARQRAAAVAASAGDAAGAAAYLDAARAAYRRWGAEAYAASL